MPFTNARGQYGGQRPHRDETPSTPKPPSSTALSLPQDKHAITLSSYFRGVLRLVILGLVWRAALALRDRVRP